MIRNKGNKGNDIESCMFVASVFGRRGIWCRLRSLLESLFWAPFRAGTAVFPRGMPS